MKSSRSLLALATSLAVLASPLTAQTLKVFLLTGQSNMEGQAYTFANPAYANWNVPSIEFLLSGAPEATTYLTNMPFGFKSGLAASWLNPRADAWCVHYDSATGTSKDVLPTSNPASIYNGVGPLSPGFGVNTNFGSMFGAELAMGIRIADSTTDPVFLFKSDKGGTTLAVNWRPPSAVAARGGSVGSSYTNTVNRFGEFLDALDADLLDDGLLNTYGNATDYEICGFFWLQGFNDGLDSGYVAEYGANLIDLIHDVRKSDARIPADLPCIVIESSDQNSTMNTGRINAVATINAEIPGSAAFFESENMINGNPGAVNWGNNPDGSPFTTGFGFHFHARAENFLELGWIAGGAVLDNNWLDASDFWLDRPVATSVGFNQAGISTAVNEAADTVTVYWGTSDPGPTATGWHHSASLGAQAAGPITASLTGLLENTTYFFRVNATSTALAADSWSASNSLTTPLEASPPSLGTPVTNSVTAYQASVKCALVQANADVTLVWAEADQGATTIAAWTSAPGGGSQAFPGSLQGAEISHLITGLTENTDYSFRFFATNTEGDDWSEAVSFTTAAVLTTLVSSALDNSQTDITGTSGIFSGTLGGDASADVAGVTTTLISTVSPLGGADTINGPHTVNLRAVSVANGMDLTYTVTISPFRYDASAGTDGVEQSRTNGFIAVRSFGNPDRESTTTLLQADTTIDVEFFRVTIGNVVNSGTTSYSLDGATKLRFNGLSFIAVRSSYVNGEGGTLLGSGGVNPALSQDDDITLSSPSTSFAIVATDDDTTGSRATFDNRWEGIAVQFSSSASGSPFDDWAGDFIDLTDSDPSLDFDGGGLATGIEWVVGGDPTDGSDDTSNAPTLDISNATYFNFTFRRRDAADADAGTDIRVEYGSDLSVWRNTTDHGAADGVLIDDSTDLGGGFHEVMASIPRTLESGGKLFARLKVALPPAP